MTQLTSRSTEWEVRSEVSRIYSEARPFGPPPVFDVPADARPALYDKYARREFEFRTSPMRYVIETEWTKLELGYM